MLYTGFNPEVRRAPMNKYETMACDLRQKIADGTYRPGDRLPTIPQLCVEYDVSKITVKRAMDELELQGLVARRRGSGTYVKGLPQGPQGVDNGHLATQLAGFTAEHEAHSQRVSALVRLFTIEQAEPGIAQELGMEQDEFCYHIERTLFADGIPLQDQVLHIPLRVVPHLTQQHAESSIYQYMEEELGLKVASAHRRVIATHANAEAAEHLQIDTTDSVLKIFQTTYLDDGRAFEKSVSLHVPGYEFFSISTR